MIHPRDAGITLIELVVALTIFAFVAVMGLQGLSGMLRIRDRLVETDQSTLALARATALLRHDMNAILPMAFFPPEGERHPALYQSRDGAMLALSIAGQPDIFDGHTFGQEHRAIWAFDAQNQELTRQIWTTLTPADVTPRSPETHVLSGVTALRVRSYWIGQGWIDGPTNVLLQNIPRRQTTDEDGNLGNAAPETYSDFLPAALEITLVTSDHGDITLIETLK